MSYSNMNFMSHYYELVKKGICFIVEKDMLRVKSIFKTNLTEEDKDFIKKNKQFIIEIVVKNNSLLTLKQENMLLLQERYENTSYNNIICTLNINGKLDKEKLFSSVYKVLLKYDALRMQFYKNEEDEYKIRLIDDSNLNFEIIEYSSSDKKFDQIMHELENYQFELSRDFPFRVVLYCESINSYKLTLVFHHIIFDGWSLGLILNALNMFYLDQASNVLTTLSYKDFLNWELAYSESINNNEKISYWQSKFQQSNQRINLPSENSSLIPGFQSNTEWFTLDSETTLLLNKFCLENNATYFNIFLSVFYLLLHTYSGDTSINIGSTFANRKYQATESIVGFFIDVMVLPICIEEINNKTFTEILNFVQQEFISGMSHIIDFNQLLSHIKIECNDNRNGLFQVMYVHQNAMNNNLTNMFGLDVSRENYKPNKLLFDLVLETRESNNNIQCSLQYRQDLFSSDFVLNMIKSFEHGLKIILSNPLKKISSAFFVTNDSYNLQVNTWNNTYQYFPEKTLSQIFEEQVEKTPDNIAVIYENERLTYKELNQKSNQLARYIKKEYKKKTKSELIPDTLIALCLDRSVEMLIGILGILKSGAAYVPIDPSYPQDRISYILEDTNVKLILTQNSIINRSEANSYILEDTISTDVTKDLSLPKDKIIEIDLSNRNIYLSGNSKIAKYSKLNLTGTFQHLTNLAYVIYTSGTTGTPKGVMIEHMSFVQFISNFTENLDSKSFNTISTTSFVFDIFGLEYGIPLLNGGYLELADLIDCQNKLDYIHRLKDKGFIQLTPSKVEIFLSQTQDILDGEKIKACIQLFIGGEPLTHQIIQKVKEANNRFKNIKFSITNVYGPTETTIWSLKKNINLKQQILIGTPLANEFVYILNKQQQLLPIGVVGELYIGGNGLARGYLNAPEITAEFFMQNPYQSEEDKKLNKNAKIYKTGDLARYTSNGDVEYVGRNDFQVKILGHRIELGEIESKLFAYPGVKQAVVLALNNFASGGKYLVGYYVSEFKLDEKAMLEYLIQHLPGYMVPSILVYLDNLPLTINGKLDRKSLPNPDFIDNNSEYVGPRDELDKSLVVIFANLLGVSESQISINADFFSLGGNSILAIKLVGLINKELSILENIKLRVSDVFKQKSIQNIANHIIEVSDDISYQNDQVKISPYNLRTKENYKLSFAQKRLWFIDNLESSTNAYNIPFVIQLSPETKLEYIIQAITEVVNRHEILRSIICQDNEAESYQIVKDINLNNLIELDNYTNKADLNFKLHKAVNYIFKLDQDIPIKITVYEKTEIIKADVLTIPKISSTKSERILCILMHHIASDGWSIDVLLKEIHQLYYYYTRLEYNPSIPYPLSELKIQYKDYALWQLDYLKGDILSKQILYWQNELSGYENLNLITDKIRPLTMDYLGDNLEFELDEITTLRLRELAKHLGISLYSIMLGGYYLLLYTYTNQTDITIGTPVSNRHHAGLEDLIGLFVNTLALRYKIDKNKSVAEYLKAIGNKVILAQTHQDLPFEQLVTILDVEKDQSRSPIFQVMFGVQSFGQDSKNQERLFTRYNLDDSIYKIAKFDLTTMINDAAADKLVGTFNYRTSLYNKETIEGLINTYKIILTNLTNIDKNSSLSLLDLVNTEQKQFLLYDYNLRNIEYPDNKAIHELFEEQVDKVPNNIALVYEDKQLTYQELNEKSNQLARYIRKEYKRRTKQELKADTLIALCLDRSLEMLIGILAILKTGGAYVPIDPNYPQDRIDYILKDTDAKLILTQNRVVNKNESSTYIFEDGNLDNKIILSDTTHDLVLPKDKIIEIDLSNKEIYLSGNGQIAKDSRFNLPQQSKSTDLAYVIYTSGTTGKPKGVMIEHKSVVNLAIMQGNAFNQDSLTFLNYLWYASYVFDAHVSEVFIAITRGHTLHLISNVVRTDLYLLKDYIIKQNVAIATIPPALLNTQCLLNLKTLVLAGEVPDKNILEIYSQNNVRVINAYGPTESTVCATLHDYVLNDLGNNIGKPISNIKSYILDNNLKPLPLGAVGELYIGGAGLARGYLNRDDLTREMFINNPFQSSEEKAANKNGRLYKTGDLVRYLADGNIEYIGRNDSQVKIRGYRIELGEIESKLSSYPEIRQAVILARDYNIINQQVIRELGGLSSGEFVDSSKYLVAYYVADNKLDEEGILSYLSSQLPEYMVPNSLVRLEKLPLTINGKLDRKALPNPHFMLKDSTQIVLPETELEIKLLKIFSETLGIPEKQISVCANFFRIGGDSIKSIRLQVIARSYGINLKILDIFQQKTIRSLCKSLLKNIANSDLKKMEKNDCGVIPCHPIQKWFFNLNMENINWFNMLVGVDIENYNIQKLAMAIDILQQVQSSFRIKFMKQNGEYVQYYENKGDFVRSALEIFHVNHNMSEESIIRNTQGSLNIESCLYKVIAIIYTENHCKLFFIAHHLIMDGVSLRIIIDNLAEIYDKLINNREINYEHYSDINSYKDYCKILYKYLNVVPEVIKNHWLNMRLLNNQEVKLIRYQDSIKRRLEVDKNTTKLLINVTNILSSQLQYILLASYVFSIKESLSISDDILIALEGHGRKLSLDNIDISNTIGWFTTIYPLNIKIKFKKISGNEYRILRDIENSLKFSESDSGSSFGALNWLDKSECLPRIANEKNISFAFNYLGEILQNNQGWKIIIGDYSAVSPVNYLPHSICLNSVIVDGLLRINFAANPNFISELQLETLVNNMENIMHIFTKCSENKFYNEEVPGFTPITVVNQFAEFANLTFVHPGSTGVESYMNNLATYISKDIRLLLVDNLIVHGKKQVSSVRELAQIYVRSLITEQPSGPYYLGGLSFGALVAIEMTNILCAMGEEVKGLFLVDPMLVSPEIRQKYFSDKKAPISVLYELSTICEVKTILFKCLHLFADTEPGFQADTYAKTTFQMPLNGLENHFTNLLKVELECDHESTLLDGTIHKIIKVVENIIREAKHVDSE